MYLYMEKHIFSQPNLYVVSKSLDESHQNISKSYDLWRQMTFHNNPVLTFDRISGGSLS